MKGGEKMSEEKETKETKEEEPKQDSRDGDKQEETSIIDQANQAKKELGEMLEEGRKMMKAQQEELAKDLLKGRSKTNREEQPNEESPKEYKERVMRGRV